MTGDSAGGGLRTKQLISRDFLLGLDEATPLTVVESEEAAWHLLGRLF